MENSQVKLLHITPKNICIAAIGKPYRNNNADIKLFEKIGFIWKHESVLEHCILQFSIEGVSRLELQENVRHRIASLTVESTRFSLNDILNTLEDYSNTEIKKIFVYPEIKNKYTEKEIKIFNNALLESNRNTIKIIRILKELGFTNDYLKYFLTENLRTNFVWTINLRSLINFLQLRLEKSAHFEIQNIASKIYKVIKNETWLGEIDFNKTLYKYQKLDYHTIHDNNVVIKNDSTVIITLSKENWLELKQLLNKNLVEKIDLIEGLK